MVFRIDISMPLLAFTRIISVALFTHKSFGKIEWLKQTATKHGANETRMAPLL
jgi:hypothetical protein